MFGFGKKDTDEVKALKKELKSYEAGASIARLQIQKLEAGLKEAKNKIAELESENTELGNEVDKLEAQNEALQTQTKPLKGKKVTLSKAVKIQIKAFEDQSKSMADSQRMYGAFTIQGKKGPELVEVNTVKEARDIIAKARAGKVTLLGI